MGKKPYHRIQENKPTTRSQKNKNPEMAKKQNQFFRRYDEGNYSK